MTEIQGKIKPIKDHVLITNMEFAEERTVSGVIIPSQNGKTEGIKPRWGQVYAVGPDQKDVSVGDWICLEHGRWTRGVTIDDNGVKKIIRRADNDAILLISDEKPNDVYIPK